MADEIKTEPVVEVKTEASNPEPVKTNSVVTEDRTSEQFKKLTESNKRLLEANKILQENLVRQQQTNQVVNPTPVVEPEIEQFVKVDPATGEQYVETDKLKRVIEETNARAKRAEVAVENLVKEQQRVERTRQQLEQQKQEKEAFEAIPEVNPSSERFDRELSKRTEALLLHSYMHPEDYGGFALTFKQAAEAAVSQSPSQAKATEKAVVEVKKEVVDTKDQVTTEVPSTSSSNVPPQGASEELDALRKQSLYGRGDQQVWAIAQRLQKITHTGTPSSKE
jgi:hypothetical protein